MTNPNYWAHSDEVGAPTLNNTAGTLIAVIDACLITGFRPQSLTSLAVASSVATATLAGHGYEVGKMVDIGGAAVTALNGRKKIVSATSGTFTFDATGVADNASVAGALTAKRSALGWVKPASGTNTAVYARSAAAASGQVLSIDDTGTTYARARMFESFGDFGGGVNFAPTEAALSGGQYWHKGANTSGAKKWILVGDERSFFLFTEFPADAGYGAQVGLLAHAFGDLGSFRAGDAYPSFIVGANAANPNGINTFCAPQAAGSINFSSQFVFARSASQIGGAVSAAVLGLSTAYTLAGAAGPAYPSPVDNGLVLQAPVPAVENNAAFGNPVRGTLPGVALPIANLGSAASTLHRTVLTDVVGYPGGVLAVATVYANSVQTGMMMFDLSNAWQ